jgi:ABC-type glycerol-3-phosphate transport system substrate-binding protein
MIRSFLRPLRSAMLLVALLALVIVGCGGDGADGDDRTVVTFWHFWGEPAQKAALEKRIKAFEEANPGIRVEMTELSYKDGTTKLLAAFNSGTQPDLLDLGSDWIPQFSHAGVLADLGAMGIKFDSYAPEVVAAGRFENGVYALPWVVDTRVIFVNRTLLAAAGLDTTVVDSSWDQLIARAEQVRARRPDAYGFGVQGDDQHRLYKKILPFFWSNGGEVLNEKGEPVINSPENIEALETYLSLTGAGVIDTQRKLDDDFVAGKIAYLFSGSWLVDRLRKDNPGLSFAVTTLPKFGDRAPMSFAGGQFLAISEASERKEQAKALAVFLASPEQALAFCKDLPGGSTPADRSVQSDPFLQGPVRGVFTRQLSMARMTPVHPKWLDIEGVIENEVVQALLGKKTSQQALNDAQARIGAIVRDGAVAASGEAEG